METLPLLAMTNPENFPLSATQEASFLPWALLFGSLAAFGIASFLFMKGFKKFRERKEDQARQGYVPNEAARKKEVNQLVKSVMLPGFLNLLGFALILSSLMSFGGLSEAAERDEIRIQGWLAAEHPDKDFGDDVLDLLSFKPVMEEAGGTWVLQEVGSGSGEYNLVEVTE